MATIRQQDLIQSVADALQHISYYYPIDYITNLARAYEMEQAAYLMTVGGAAYLVSKAPPSRVLAFEDSGMEAIYEFGVKEIPVTVAVDSQGTTVHQTGPKEWQARIAGIPILQ